MRSFLIALQFLTQLPVRFSSYPEAEQIGRSLNYYPLVGLIIGGVLAVLAELLTIVPPLLGAALLLSAWVWLTGGLHLDGLADSADAWVGGLGDRDKTLAIMKDPRSGPAAVVILILLLLIKFAALHAIVSTQYWQALLLAPILGRTVLPLLFLCTPYVRSQGLGSALTNYKSRYLGLVISMTLLMLVIMGGLTTLWLIVIAVLVLVMMRRLMLKRVGGCTGDTAGALVEVTEVAILLTMVILIL